MSSSFFNLKNPINEFNLTFIPKNTIVWVYQLHLIVPNIQPSTIIFQHRVRFLLKIHLGFLKNFFYSSHQSNIQWVCFCIPLWWILWPRFWALWNQPEPPLQPHLVASNYISFSFNTVERCSKWICVCTPEWFKDDPICHLKPAKFLYSIFSHLTAMRGDIIPSRHF